MTGFALSPQVFAILSSLIEEHTGLYFSLDDRELLADKVAPRARALGLDSLIDYYYFLRYDPSAEAELLHLIDALVVNETYFFRELGTLEVAVGSLVPELIAAGAKPRIWCAACATGEEPFTLAMLLDAAGLLDQVTLVASDVSARALERARAGVYVRRSLRALPAGVTGRWLEPTGDGMRVTPRIAESVDFRRVNLVSEEQVAALGVFDLIICRNVLIYFSDSTNEQVISSLARCLRPNGRLIVGASESLLRFDSVFVCEERSGSFFYRKSEG